MSLIMPKSIDNVNRMVKSGGKPGHPRRGRPPSDDVLDLVHTLMHRYRALRQRSLRALQQDLTPMDMRVLGFFGRQPGATQSDLAQHSGRDKAQLARLVKGLRERGLLDAQADTVDRRNLRLQLTPQGEALQRAAHEHAQMLGALAVEGIDAAEQAHLRALLLRMDANLQRVADPE